MTLSCDPAQETLSVCIHGAPVKFGRCLLCNPMERKTVNIGDLIDELIALRNRIEALHEYKLRQIDDHRKLNKWQEGIQKQINDVIGLFVKADSVLENDIIKLQQSREAHSRSNKDIFERIDGLEKLYYSSTDVEQVLLNRINELEDKLENIIPRVWSAEQKGCIAMDAIEGNGRFKGKSPHKCPICDGKGKLYPDKPETGMIWDFKDNNQVCDSCQGKGILWG